MELLERAIRVAQRWDEVSHHLKHVVLRRDMSERAEPAMEASFRKSEEQGLFRHCALADALALRAAYIEERLFAAPREPGAFHIEQAYGSVSS